MHLSGFKSTSPDRAVPDTGQGYKVFEAAIALFWAFLVIVLAVFYHGFISNAIQSYEASYSVQYVNPLPTFMMELFALLSSVMAVYLALKRNPLCWLASLALFAGNLTQCLMMHEKTPVVFGLFGIGYLYFYWVRNKQLAIIGAVAGFALALFVLLPMYHIINDGHKNEGIIKQYIEYYHPTFTSIDPSGPMSTAVAIMKEDKPKLWGESFVKDLSLFVPRAIWPDRPIDISEQFAREKIPNWEPGVGLGFSPLGEAYMNFGFGFSFIEFLAFGLLWGWMWRGFKNLLTYYNAPMHFDVIYRIMGSYIILLFFRGLFMGSIKKLIMCMIPIGGALLGMMLLVWLWQQWQARKAATI
jgi:hypothetical protein